MSQIKAIAKNTVIQFGGKLCSTILGLIAIMMLTDYLGVEQFGWYTTTISFLQFIGIMIDFGMTPVTSQMLGEGRIPEKKLIANIITFRAITAALFLGFAPLVALFFPYPIEVKIAIAFSTISFFAQAMNQVYLGIFQAKLSMMYQAIGECVSRLFLVIGLAGFIWLGLSFLPIMGVIAGAGVLYAVIQCHYAHTSVPLRFAIDFDIWKAIIKKSWPITLSIVFNVLYLRGDVVILSLYVSQVDIGLYGAAYRVIDILTQTAMMIMGLMLPILTTAYHTKKSSFATLYKHSVTLMCLVGAPLIVGSAVLASPIITFVASNDFIRASSILMILSIAVIGTYIGAIYGHVAVALNKQKQTIWIYVLGACITLLGYIIFIPRYGIYGAAWLTVLSELLVGLLLFIQLRSYIGVGLPWKKIGAICGASVLMGIVVYYLQGLPLLLTITIGAIIYSAIMLLSKTISPSTLRHLTS